MPRTRSIIATAAGVLLAALPAATLAHAELTSSRPAADAVLETPPTEVVVTFVSELDPDTSALVVTDPADVPVGEGTVDLDVADRNVLVAAVNITGDGEYEVSWTAGSIDGHVESDTFVFRVGMHTADTALPAPPSGGVVVGTLLLLMAAALGLRQRRRSER